MPFQRETWDKSACTSGWCCIFPVNPGQANFLATPSERDPVARRPRGQLRLDILRTVIELLIETGDVDAVSIDSVVDRVGCTPPALYYYFPTKTDLLREACETEFRRLADEIGSEVDQGPGGHIWRLRMRGVALLRFAKEHPALYRVLFMGPGRDDLTSGEALADDPSLMATRQNLKDAMDDGLMHPVDPDLMTLTLWGMTHGYAALSVSFPKVPLEALMAAFGKASEAMSATILTEAGLKSREPLDWPFTAGIDETGSDPEPEQT